MTGARHRLYLVKLLITCFTKTQQHRTTGRAEQWAFDNCRHFQHQCGSGVGIIDAIAQRLVEFAPGGATGVQQRLPAQLGNKGIQLRTLKAIGAVIMEAILNLMRFQPAAGFLMVSQFLIPYMVSIDKPFTFN
ncbi:Uncharacterised protein [Klebsiella pneumoniae]|uniref:Uncharacterized protein n=1 Tax=Klebsiella pneumoniae TaxID=573 RepID=A0A377WM07_KLEPN|nr:Uncharacterised protein [Klebsiella pneumoniae]